MPDNLQPSPTRWQRWLSYLWPLTRRVPSAVNGPLEITLSNGRKLLDSRRANYSYGALQRVLRHGLQQIWLPTTGTVLLLGLGGGSVIQTLRQEQGFRGHITAVELDPVVIELAATEFGVRADAGLRIIEGDALTVWPTLTTLFDLVIVDVFIDLVMPRQLFTPGFWEALRGAVRPGGYIIFNAIADDELRVSGAPLLDYLAGLGIEATEHRVEGLNRLVIGQRWIEVPPRWEN